MSVMILERQEAGYSYIKKILNIDCPDNWHRSYIGTTNNNNSIRKNGYTETTFRASYEPANSICAHLEFALKYDGTNFMILSQIFEKISEQELIHYIQSKRTGKYTRRIWFFYEFLTGKTLALSSLQSGNYIQALEDKDYYTVNNGEKVSRYRIVNNLLGIREFCPIVRKTKVIIDFENENLHTKCLNLVANHTEIMLKRVIHYLYKKETKSSFTIENVKPNPSRIEKFIALLELAEQEDFCTKENLIALQNAIVDSRFINNNYRKNQNYVGESIGLGRERIHFICPKPEDIKNLMSGLLDVHKKMMKGEVNPVIHAAIIAFGFVFLHPFEDGNGRIHRFLIHNILSKQNFVPQGIMFPVSAVMLKEQLTYDTALELFSKAILPYIEYDLDEIGTMEVQNTTKYLYAYMDITSQSECLFQFIKKTIEVELVEEFSFLQSYDKTKKSIQEVIDIPDRLIDLFIQVCLRNNGTLSLNKKEKYFSFLRTDEIIAMEDVVRRNYTL